MNPELLKAFLVGLPHRLDFKNHESIGQNLDKALYYAVSDEGALLKELFPDMQQEVCDTLHNYEFPIIIDPGVSPFGVSSKKHSHPPDRVCSRPVIPGEPMFTCKQCGLDETCVLCMYCFNKEDHVNHEVAMNISQGDALCDCGDSEAFSKLNCKCAMEPLDHNVPTAFNEPIRQTVRTCLDYILDVVNFSVQQLPLFQENMTLSTVADKAREISDHSALPSSKYGGAIDTQSTDSWLLMLWNDENHTVDEAENAISRYSTNGRDIALEIDETGRGIISEAKDCEGLRSAQVYLSQNGFVSTIISARDFSRECIASHMLNWLLNIIEFPNNSIFREVAKTELSHLLLEPNFQFATSFPAKFTADIAHDPIKLFENAILIDGNFSNLGLCSLSPTFKTEAFLESATSLLQPKSQLDQIENSRLQYFLAFQIRFPNSVREKLVNSLIIPILTDTEQKGILTNQLMAIYPMLIASMAVGDREYQLNCMFEITSQLFTCPTSVASVLERNEVGQILGPLTKLIEEKSSRGFDHNCSSFIHLPSEPAQNLSISNAIVRGIGDFKLLTEPEFAGKHASKFFETENLTMLLLFLRNFQGYWSMPRKTGDHVEIESYDFLVHLEFSLSIVSAIKSIAAAEISTAEAQDAVSLIVEFLVKRVSNSSTSSSLTFNVSEHRVGFVNVINSFLSFLLQNFGIEIFLPIWNKMREPFKRISEFSLRSIVLGAQIKVGLWVRNGISASRAAVSYIDSPLRHFTLFRDFHLNQIALCLDEPDLCLINLLGTWELSDWYSGEESHEATVYEDRFSSISEKFIIFLYNMLTDRSAFIHASVEEISLAVARNETAYALCDEPKSFSQIKAQVGDGVVEMDQFEEILNSVADYRPPTGLVDIGLYILKPSVYESLDPLSMYLDANKYQVVTESLTRNIASAKNIKQDEVVLIPRIADCHSSFVMENIGRFARTGEFSKLLKKFFLVAIDSSDESYLSPLLHLLHAILIDGEMVHWKGYISVHFTEDGISDMLLTISKSSMSKVITRKAGYLLDYYFEEAIKIMSKKADESNIFIVPTNKRRSPSLSGEIRSKRGSGEDRRAKVMRKFARQRQKFLSTNIDLEIVDPPESDSTEILNLRTCVSCGESESFLEPFGILATSSYSSIFWKMPWDDPDYAAIAFKSYDNQMTPSSGPNLYGKGYARPKSSAKVAPSGDVISTCGHNMHLSCFKKDLKTVQGYKEITCPLCSITHDTFVPSCIGADASSSIQSHTLRELSKHSKYSDIWSSSSRGRTDELASSLIHKSYELPLLKNLELATEVEVVDQMREIFAKVDVSKSNPAFTSAMRLNLLIANTIRMNEITTRIEGEISLSSFSSMVPGSARFLIKSLMQLRSISFVSSTTDSSDFGTVSSKFWQLSNSADHGSFFETIHLFFQTGESLSTLVEIGTAKLLTIIAASMLKYIDSRDTEIFSKPEKVTIPVSVQHDLKKIFEHTKKSMGLANVEVTLELVNLLYSNIERMLLPYLRQCCIFHDLLTCTTSIENQHISTTESVELEASIREQPYLGCSEALTSFLGSKSLKETICDIASHLGLASTTGLLYDVYVHTLRAEVSNSDFQNTIDYPGVVKLIDLPKDYNNCIINGNSDYDFEDPMISDRFNLFVCLHCSAKVAESGLDKHSRNSMGPCALFYLPSSNVLRIYSRVGLRGVYVDIRAPYLTVHGEFKGPYTDGRATLHEYRYRYINQLWLNHNLRGFVTRRAFGGVEDAWTVEDMNAEDSDQEFEMAEDLDEADMEVEVVSDGEMENTGDGNEIVSDEDLEEEY